MSLFNWFFGFNKRQEIIDALEEDRHKLLTIMSIAQQKLKLFNAIGHRAGRESFQRLEKCVREIEKLDVIELRDTSKVSLLALVNKLDINEALKEHIKCLLGQYIENIRKQIEWFNAHKSLPERKKRLHDLEVLIRTEISILFGLVHHDMRELEREVENTTKLEAKAHEDIKLLREEKIELDEQVLSIGEKTQNFKWLYVREKEELLQIVSKYRRIIKDIDDLVLSKRVDGAQKRLLERLAYEIYLQVHQLDPILRDPHINPYSNTLSYSETMYIIEHLKPCYVVLSKESLLNILKSASLKSRVLTKTDRGKYMISFKRQSNAVFVSAGGPFRHLPIKSPREASVIIFKRSLYNLPMTIYPRDSGGYPEIKIDKLLSQAQKDIEYLMKRRQFKDVSMMFRYMFNHIKHRQLRASEKDAIVGLKIPQKNVALFPEMVIVPKIGLVYAEAILVPEQVYFSEEMTKLKEKYKGLLKPVPNPLEAYWNYVGLRKSLS